MNDYNRCHSVYLRINPRKIYFLKFILEGYDGIAVLSTIDMQNGIVVIRYPYNAADPLFKLISTISKNIGLKQET